MYDTLYNHDHLEGRKTRREDSGVVAVDRKFMREAAVLSPTTAAVQS
jgi:hypothetical protein